MHNAKLRAAVATIALEMERLPAGDGLRAPWAHLVELMALGPAPELRDCPTCRRTVMRAATLCGHCWTKLTPPTATAGA